MVKDLFEEEAAKYGYDLKEAKKDAKNGVFKMMTKQEKAIAITIVILLWVNGISLVVLYFQGYRIIASIQLAAQILLALCIQGLRRRAKKRKK